MDYFKGNYSFPRFQREPTIFQGGPTFSSEGRVWMLIRIEPIELVIFQGGGVWIHYPPLVQNIMK